MYCTYDRQKINAWRARGARAWVSVNFRKFSPCMARARRACGFDSLPSPGGRCRFDDPADQEKQQYPQFRCTQLDSILNLVYVQVHHL